MTIQQDIIAIPLKNKVVTLKIENFDTDIDTDDIVKIQYNNIMGEILTFPVLINRIGNLQAEIDELLSEKKFALEIKTAELDKFYRQSLQTLTTDSKGNDKIKDPTENEIKSSITLDKDFQILKKAVITLQKNKQIIDSLYWSAQSKDTKLSKLTEKLRPEEFERELLEDNINGILIKINKNLIQ